MKKGDRVYVSGNSDELWIEDYNVSVSTSATVEETPGKYAKKILLTLDSIDGEGKVCCYVKRSKIKPIEYLNGTNTTMIIDGVTVCCGYDFGVDFPEAKYCPICGRKLIKDN